MKPLVFEDVLTAISQLKQELIANGQLRSDGLASAIATIEQGFDGVVLSEYCQPSGAFIIFCHQKTLACRRR